MSPGDNEAPALELSAHESIRCASIVVYKQTELKLALLPCPLLMAHFPPGVERPAACLVSAALPVALAISGEKKICGRECNLFPIKTLRAISCKHYNICSVLRSFLLDNGSVIDQKHMRLVIK